MNINILAVVLVILAVWRGCRGGKRGITGEIYHLMTLVISLFVISVAILLYTSIKEKNTLNIVLSVAVLLITGVVSKLVDLVMKSLKAIAHLPGLSFVDKMLGIVVGAAEAVVVLWIVYVLIGKFDTGAVGSWILEQTRQNVILQKINDLNQVAYWLAGVQDTL